MIFLLGSLLHNISAFHVMRMYFSKSARQVDVQEDISTLFYMSSHLNATTFVKACLLSGETHWTMILREGSGVVSPPTALGGVIRFQR